VLTGSDQVSEITKAHDLGANSYLVKPGDFNELVEMVKQIKGDWLLDVRPRETGRFERPAPLQAQRHE